MAWGTRSLCSSRIFCEGRAVAAAQAEAEVEAVPLRSISAVHPMAMPDMTSGSNSRALVGPKLQQAFKNAADYLTTVITDDIGGGGLYRGKIIDDLYVTAELKAIDGTGGVLGQAGPTALWSANDLTAAGQMQFDVADALTYSSLGLWDDIVIHEFMHVLGFGSLWNYGSHSLVSGTEYTGDTGRCGLSGGHRYKRSIHSR